MPIRESYDFLQWTSFPSSLRVSNDEGINIRFRSRQFIPVKTPATIRIEGNIKVENGSITEPAWIAVVGWNAAGREVARFGTGGTVSQNWVKMEASRDMPTGIANIELRMVCAGSGTKGKVATTWFDDLKIYQDDELIYDNYFTALRPGRVVPVIWTPPERIIGAYQRWKQGEKALIFKPPRLLQTIKV